jgi:predicted regulator of Ras-like GTPase activity (Roadblock/LC7/MglB family)
LLERATSLNRAATELPKNVRNRRLKLETAVILGLAMRLTQRLRNNDPLAGRVKLKKIDVILSVVGSAFRL